MNIAILENYNRVVLPNDEVYCLGDCMLGGADKLEAGLVLMRSLNGKLHIVRGNHDTDKRIEAYHRLPNVVEMQNAIYLKYNGYHFYFSHFPTMTSNVDDKGLKHCTLGLCGHSHVTDRWAHWEYGAYHAEVDCHNMSPCLLDDIIKDMKQHQNAISGQAMFDSGKCVKCENYILGNCSTVFTKQPCPGFNDYRDSMIIH